MSPVRSRPAAAVLAGLALLASGCSSAPEPHEDRQAKASRMTSTPAHTSLPGTVPPGEPGDGLGQPVDSPVGKVAVDLSASVYEQGQVISVLIANGLDRTVYAQDSKTDCAIAFLQRQEETGWTDIPACAVLRPPVTWAIGPRHGRTVSFDPSSVNFAAVSEGRPALGAGTYRVKFTFRTAPGPEGEEPLVAFSRPFVIR
jgi:hypothetical protein